MKLVNNLYTYVRSTVSICNNFSFCYIRNISLLLGSYSLFLYSRQKRRLLPKVECDKSHILTTMAELKL